MTVEETRRTTPAAEIPVEVMKRSTPVEIMRKNRAVAEVPVVPAVAEIVDPRAISPAGMWEKPAVLITEEPSTTARSLTLPTTVENRWNLSAAQA